MKNLIAIRKSKGLLQKDVAAKLGISRTTYCSYENDINEPSISILNKIADYFNVTIDELLDRKTVTEIFTDARIAKPEYQDIYERLSSKQQELILERLRAYDEINRSNKT